MKKKKRGFFSQLWYDICHIEELMPHEISLFEDKKLGISAGKIRNPPNQYVPELIEWYHDDEEEIYYDRIINKRDDSGPGVIEFAAGRSRKARKKLRITLELEYQE